MSLKPRTKFLLGGAFILAVAGYLMASAIAQTGTYYLTPTELASKVAQDPRFTERASRWARASCPVRWCARRADAT